MKKRWTYAVSLLLFTVLMVFSDEAKAGAAEGLRLWWELLLPAMFPAFAAMGLLRNTGAAEAAAAKAEPFLRRTLGIRGESFMVLFAGLTGGYPLGAKALCDSVLAGQLTKAEGDRLYRTCDNTGPAFAIGAIGIGLFRSSLWGVVLWGVHAVTALVLTRLFSSTVSGPAAGRVRSAPVSFGHCLSDSLSDAACSMVAIGGYVVLFSALPFRLLFRFLRISPAVSALLQGALELTSGIGALSGLPLSPSSLAAAEFLLSFGGLCVHLQSLAVTEAAGLNGKERLRGKLLHGVLSSAIAYGIGLIFL